MPAPFYDPLDDLSVLAATTGVDTAPPTSTAQVARLQQLADSALKLGWITSKPLYGTLDAEASSDDYASVSAFANSLDSARNAGTAVTDNAYYLLKANVTYALAHISPPSLSASITGDTATSIYTAHPSGGTPGYSYLWEWCAIDCGGGGAELRAPPGHGVHPNEVEHGWHDVGYYTDSICWTMSGSTLRLTVTDASSTQVIAYYAVPTLEHVC